ncbi:unnamed protein product [Aureobasidium vineae]|uniref:Uncharacterized protein n=1 Tax=Aureobasidium vineae TaxID=2773715 RepID=A0A9N8JSM2_9PEZI|nr:unnamed protein product [Aureobasidium vineae]
MASYLDGIQGKTFYRIMSAACGSAFMLYGIQETPQFRAAIGNPQGAFIIPVIASIYNLAAGIMSLCVSFHGMQIGRKGTILLGCLLICIGALLQASTYSVGQIIVGRIVTGAVLLFMLPDAPRWYYARGHEARGDKVLARLHALPVAHESVQAVKADIMASLEEEDDTGKISIVTLFWDNTELQFGHRLRTSKSSVGINWAAVAIIILYEVVFAFGWLGTCWVYGPEIAPLKYRHVAGSLGAAGEWFSTFVMVFGGGTGINAVGPKIFIWPLLCCFLAAAYVYFLCPEKIDALFARSPEVRERLERDIAACRAGGMPPSMKLSPRDSSDMSKMDISTVEKI